MNELAFDSIELMQRPGKPRTRGIAYVRDRGLDYICDHGPLINLFVDITRTLALESSRLGAWGKHQTMARTAVYSRGTHAGLRPGDKQ